MTTHYIGLDVHKQSIAISVAEEGRKGEVRSYGSIENTPNKVAKLLKRFEKTGAKLQFCYEAGPCGYDLYRQITGAGYACIVVAPSMIPRKPGEMVKTDRRDAVKLARLLRAGEIESVWVPDPAHEAMRDLLRARGDARHYLQAARQQLQSFLLRHGRIYTGRTSWSKAHFVWLSDQKFDHVAHQIVFQDYINAIHDARQRHDELVKQIKELVPSWSMCPLVNALCVIKGIDLISASSILSVTGDLRRFDTPIKLGSYFGLVPAEHSSGGSVKRSGITRSGNGEARRILIQCAWCYRFPARVSMSKENLVRDSDKMVRDIAWRAQKRLCQRYRHLSKHGKRAPVVAAAIARELTTFIWEMGQAVSIPNPG